MSSKNEKIEKRAFLAAQLEEARKDLRKPGPKLPITMYDYFVLVLIIVVFIGHYSYWWFALANPILWERPRILFRHAVFRMQKDRQLRESIKVMEAEMKALQKDE